jgi:hypothetical protein
MDVGFEPGNEKSPINSVKFRGRGTWNRTTILGFGDPYTNRCTMPLSSIIVPDKRANENVLHGKTNK